MGKVFIDLGITLDGFIAGPNGGPKNPLGDGGIAIHDWMFKQKAFLEHIEMEGGDTDNIDNTIIEEIFGRIGANIMGKRMFEEGESNWPENAPFHSPVFVLTKEVREPWKRKGGTTFYFINDGIGSAFEIAKAAAGNKDIRISGGANTIRQFLNAGLVDEFDIHLTPLLLGSGVRLFNNIAKHDGKEKFLLEISKVIHSPLVTHIFYKVINNN